MSICGKPAVYFGSLVLGLSRSYSQVKARTTQRDIPFCGECTLVPGDGYPWHRTFVSDRPALPGESCAAFLSETVPGL